MLPNLAFLVSWQQYLDLRGSNRNFGENSIMVSPIIRTLHRVLIRVITPRRMRRAGHVALHADMRNAYKILVGKPEWKKPFRKLKCGWEDNIKIYGKFPVHGLDSSGSG
jgi:hypothetical protein